MNINRIKQILSSPSSIQVEYHGIPVWISSCNEESGTATVHDVQNPNELLDVSVNELQEK